MDPTASQPDPPPAASEPAAGPLELLGVIGSTHVAVTEQLEHHEVFSWDGLLTLLWHHAGDGTGARIAVLCCGGALGGVLGPAGGLFHELGQRLATAGTAETLRVGYRVPNDLDRCVVDVLAAAQLAARQGAERFLTVGHSFGGAVAIQAGAALGERCVGVLTFATQSAGCEPGEALAASGTPVLLVHGDRDDILPAFASQVVQMLVGGELVILAGGDHRLAGVEAEVRAAVYPWIDARLDGAV